MIQNVDHINIVVSDLDRSTRFYRDVLGFTATRTGILKGDWIESVVGLSGVSARVVFMEAPEGGPRIELLCYETPAGGTFPEHSLPNTTGLRHIAFRVKDMDAALQRLRDHEVTFVGSDVTVPDSVITHDAGRKRLCYFKDPDGTLLEIAAYGTHG